MQFLRRLVALAVLALWLPTTLHCALEAAGVAFGDSCCAEDASAEGCEVDGCQTVEGEFRLSTPVQLTAPAPMAAASFLLCPRLVPAIPPAPPPVTGVITAAEAPREFIRAWCFALRAAPAPRAPSVVS